MTYLYDVVNFGTLAQMGEKTRMSIQPKDIKTVSTVGAGDSFGAAYVGAFIKTGDPEKAAGFGSMVAELVIQSTEAVPPYTDEIYEVFAGL